MRIVYCIGSLSKAGGAERVLVNKSNLLADIEGFEVYILISNQNGNPVCYPISEKVRIIDLNINQYILKSSSIPLLSFWKNIKVLKEVYQKKVNELRPDIIINIERGYEDFILPSLKPRIPCIRETHSSKMAVALMDNSSFKSSLKKRFLTLLYGLQLNKYDEVVTLTRQDQKDRRLKNGNIVIPNVLLNRGTPSVYASESKKVISAGRLDIFKNFQDQIYAWKEVARMYPEWSLHIYGNGPEEFNLRRLIKELELEHCVYLEGHTHELYAKYSEASFFISTSLAEGFAMVIAEALQTGLPVIAYDCACGPSEMVIDSVNGFLIEVADRKKLVTAITGLISDVELRRKMSRSAIEKSKDFLPEKIIPKWVNVFKDLKNGKRSYFNRFAGL